MPTKRPSNPLIEPVFVTGVGFDLFGPDHVVMTLHYPATFENLTGPQKVARFILQADQMKALGAKFSEAADLSTSMKNPPGSA